MSISTAESVESVYNAILHRRSMGLSRLKPDAVERALIEQMLEAANWAPSHGDTEPWRFFTDFHQHSGQGLSKGIVHLLAQGDAAICSQCKAIPQGSI